MKCRGLRATAPRDGYSLAAPITKRSPLNRGRISNFLVGVRTSGQISDFLASEKPQVAVAGGKIRDLTPIYGLIAAMTLPMN